MASGAGDKYLTTQALEWFDGVKARLWSWFFENTTAITYFIVGALVVYFEPKAVEYAVLAFGALFLLALLVGCLVPIAYLVEWALRKVSKP